MNHCLISNFRLFEGSKFHFRFSISTSGEWIEPWPVNDKGMFDVTLNENCCHLASGMAQAVLIIVGTFFDGLFKGFTDQKRLVVRTGPGPRKFRNSWTKSDRSVPRRGWSVDPCLFLCLIFLYFLKRNWIWVTTRLWAHMKLESVAWKIEIFENCMKKNLKVWNSNSEFLDTKLSNFSIFPTYLSNSKSAQWWIPGITVGTFVELEIGLLTNLDEFPQQVIIYMINDII